jgi:uncharacterized membrane protein YphA (DoxX/SURF4 family)
VTPPRRRPEPAPTLPLATRLGLFGLRVFLGAVLLSTFQYKFQEVGYETFRRREYVETIQAGIDDPPLVFDVPWTGYARFLDTVMLPNGDVFAPLILGAEAALGLSLVLGAGVRLSGALGFLLMAAFGLARNAALLGVKNSNWILAAGLLFLSLAAAGRTWGLDAVLRRRLPRWIS